MKKKKGGDRLAERSTFNDQKVLQYVQCAKIRSCKKERKIDCVNAQESGHRLVRFDLRSAPSHSTRSIQIYAALRSDNTSITSAMAIGRCALQLYEVEGQLL